MKNIILFSEHYSCEQIRMHFLKQTEKDWATVEKIFKFDVS